MQNPSVLADSEDWVMVMSLTSEYFGRFKDFINLVTDAAARTLSVTSSEEVGWGHGASWDWNKAVVVVLD